MIFPVRDCLWCGLPLPAGHRWTQLYHTGGCKTEATRKRKREQYRRKKLKKEGFHVHYRDFIRDPMKKLGMDYVDAKLKEVKKETKS